MALRVDWVIPCRYVEVNGGLATMVGAGIDTFTPPTLPSPLMVPTAIRLVGRPDDIEHTLSVTILDPEMQPTGDPLLAPFTQSPNPLLLPGHEGALLLPVLINFLATEEGVYTATVEVDGNSKSIPLRVTATPPVPV